MFASPSPAVSSRRRLRSQVAWPGLGLILGVGCGGSQDREAAHEGVVDGHQRTRVVELAAVVGCTENGDKLPAAEELVAVFHHLMGSTDEIDIILLEELFDDGFTEGIRNTAIVLSPARLAFLWVGP